MTGFELGVGDTAQINMAYDNMTGNLGLQLYDSSGSGIPLATSTSGDGSEDISYTVTGLETQPFYLLAGLVTPGGYSDYTLTGTR